MKLRFPRSLYALFLSSVLALVGCNATMPNMPESLKAILPIAAGGVAAVTCYKNIGSGGWRLVTGAACGAGAYVLTKSLFDNADDRTAKGVQDEYQKALNARPDTPTDYGIQYKDKAGQPVSIRLSMQRTEYYAPSTMCRAFRETVTEGRTLPPTDRRACREQSGAWAMVT